MPEQSVTACVYNQSDIYICDVYDFGFVKIENKTL